jgi:hypothetical protein
MVVRTGDPWRELVLGTDRGYVRARLLEAAQASAAVLLVGAGTDALASPPSQIDRCLEQRLPQSGITLVRVFLRDPSSAKESILDVLAGIEDLAARGIKSIALVGQPPANAVVEQAAAICPLVACVVTLGTSATDTEALATLPGLIEEGLTPPRGTPLPPVPTQQ